MKYSITAMLKQKLLSNYVVVCPLGALLGVLSLLCRQYTLVWHRGEVLRGMHSSKVKVLWLFGLAAPILA